MASILIPIVRRPVREVEVARGVRARLDPCGADARSELQHGRGVDPEARVRVDLERTVAGVVDEGVGPTVAPDVVAPVAEEPYRISTPEVPAVVAEAIRRALSHVVPSANCTRCTP